MGLSCTPELVTRSEAPPIRRDYSRKRAEIAKESFFRHDVDKVHLSKILRCLKGLRRDAPPMRTCLRGRAGQAGLIKRAGCMRRGNTIAPRSWPTRRGGDHGRTGCVSFWG